LPIDLSQGGDETIAAIYEELGSGLQRYALKLARDADRADDLVQETFVRAMSYAQLLEQLNQHQRRAWLCRTCRNLFLDQQRALQRRQALVEQLIQQAQSGGYTGPITMLYDILPVIPERYRELLQQRYILGMTSQEIGDELGVPAATVRSRLRLARKWLRKNQSKLR
jgi:RNA polymerase sigma-70 factor (ECF subfamily)